MANDITAATLLAQKSIESLRQKYPIFSLFSVDFGAATGEIGQTVNVPVFGNAAAVKKPVKGSSIDYSGEAGGSISTIPVVMDSLIFSAHPLSPYDVENLSDTTKAQIITENAHAVHAKADAVIAELALKTENHTVYTCAGKDAFTLGDLIAARGVAAASKMDTDNLVVVLSPKAYNDLIADDKVAKSLTTAAQDAIVGGRISEIVGIKVTTSAAIKSGYFGYLAQKSSVAVAARPTVAIGAAWSQVLSVEGGFSCTAKGINDAVHAQEIYVAEIAFGAEAVKHANEKRIIALAAAA